MKAKFIVPFILFIVVSGFAGNWIYGSVSAKRLDAYLSQFPDNTRPRYSDLRVNPLCSKIIFKDFSYPSVGGNYSVESDLLEVSMRHAEAMAISKSRRVDELTKMELDFKNMTVLRFDEPVFTSENLLFDFEGDMNQERIMNLSHQFPDHKQEVSIRIANGEWSGDHTWAGFFGGVPEGLNKIESAYVKMELDHEDRELELEVVDLNTGSFKFKSDAEVNYTGEGLDDFLASKVDVEYDCKLMDELSWGDSRTTGRYNVKSFASAFEGVLELDERGEMVSDMAHASFSFGVKDITVKYEGNAADKMEVQLSMIGLQQEDLYVDEFSFNTKVEEGRCIVQDTKMILPVLHAQLNADFSLIGNALEDSEINEMELRISAVAPRLMEALVGLESVFGFEIPRDGDDIVFEVKGSVNKPQVKGIHY